VTESPESARNMASFHPSFVISKPRYLLELYNSTLGHERGTAKDQGRILHRQKFRQNAALRAAMKISAKDHCGTSKPESLQCGIYRCELQQAGHSEQWPLKAKSRE
jgi:hypothetical protein